MRKIFRFPRVWGMILLSLLMAVCLSSCGLGSPAEQTVVRKFYADSPQDKYGFDSSRTIDGEDYQLSGEKYKVLRKTSAPTRQLTALSGKRTAFTPGQSFSIGDVPYVVQSVSVKTEPVQETMAVKSQSAAPETIKRVYEDSENSELRTNLTYSLQSVEQNSSESWSKAEPFTINLVGYGGKYYDIGTTKLSGKNTLSDISKQQKAVLEAQGLSSSANRISGVKWAGKEYKDSSGNRCRDIQVDVETKSAPYTAKYTANLYRFTVNYVPQGSQPEQYLIQGTATYSPVKTTPGWVRIVFLVVLILGICLLLWLGRYIWKEHQLLTSGKEIREIDGVRYTEDDF